MTNYLYQQLVRDLTEQIQTGQRAIGERMPSVRQLSRDQAVSKSTVLAAYNRLEADGLITARPRSGYFVALPQIAPSRPLKPPRPSQPETTPVPITAGQVLVDIMEKGAAFDLVSSHDRSSGNDQLRRCMARAQRRQTNAEQMNYDQPAGLYSLRQQLVPRLAHGGSRVQADDLVITAGCQNALLLALMATSQRGDVVAVESPGFYGVFQLLEVLGLKVLELPSSAELGLSPEALELALQHWDIKTLVVSPCYGTPTGASMPELHKQRIIELIQNRGIAVIEDDIYGDLGFSLQRPRTLHSYDDSGSVLLCSSFSKSLSRDLRIGWIAAGRYRDKVKQLKLVTTLASSCSQQQGLSFFLEEGGYDRHLRLRQQQLQQQYQQLLQMIPEYLPMAVSCSQPQGGLSLWLEFAETVDTLKLYKRALDAGIILTPGRLFTAQERYHNALRVSFAHPWTEPRKAALSRLGELLAGS
ncbi:MAG: PLP-dependent aminotransferase family protein [Halopseudomonas sp.]